MKSPIRLQTKDSSNCFQHKSFGKSKIENQIHFGGVRFSSRQIVLSIIIFYSITILFHLLCFVFDFDFVIMQSLEQPPEKSCGNCFVTALEWGS